MSRMSTSSYTPEIGASICGKLCEGQSLRSICAAEGMPDKSTVMTWLHRHPDFRAMYIAARELGAEAMADEVIAIATAPMKAEDAPVVRVRLDAVKWAAAKFAPKRWGDRVQAELSGPGGAPLQIMPAVPMVPTQVAQAVRDLIGKAEQEMGLAQGEGTDQERLQRLLLSGEPLPPDVYEIVHTAKE
jgi:hypothetical protein